MVMQLRIMVCHEIKEDGGLEESFVLVIDVDAEHILGGGDRQASSRQQPGVPITSLMT
jgi:hypothetical protein